MADQYRKGMNFTVRSPSQIYHDAVPTNMRMLAEYALGRKEPIKADDFTKEELQAILNMHETRKAANLKQQADLRNPEMARQKFDQGFGGWDSEEDPKTGQLRARKRSYEQYLAERAQSADSYDKTADKVSLHYFDSSDKRGGVERGWLDSLTASFDPNYNVGTTLGNFNTYNEGDRVRVEDNYKFNPLPKDDPRGLLDTLYDAARKGPVGGLELLMQKYGRQDPLPVDFTIPKGTR